MGKQIDVKSIILITAIVTLISAAAYLTFLIQDGTNPLVLLNSQASEDEIEGSDPFADEERLLADASDEIENSPTPTITFRSTSPSPSPTIGLTAASPTIDEASPTVAPTELPETGGTEVSTPTPVTQLPVAGIGDYLHPAMYGGIFLIIVALML